MRRSALIIAVCMLFASDSARSQDKAPVQARQETLALAPTCLDVKAEVPARIEECKRVLASGKVTREALLSALGGSVEDDDKNGRVGDLISTITVILDLDPGNIDLRKLRAVAYYSTKQHDLALADFNELVRIEPDSVFALRGRGATLLEKGDPDRAIAELTELLRSGQDVRTFLFRGRAFVSKQDYVRALQDFDAALIIEPDHEEAIERRNSARAALAAQRKQQSVPRPGSR